MLLIIKFKILSLLYLILKNNDGVESKKNSGYILTLSILKASFLERKINELFCLENASNLAHEFLNHNFNKKI